MKASWALQHIGNSRPVFSKRTVVICNVANVPVSAPASVSFVPLHGKSYAHVSSQVAGVSSAATAAPAAPATTATAPPPQLQHPIFRDLSMFRPMAKVEYIEPQALADIMKSAAKDSVKVMDVRDSDFEGGHIKNAVNIESSQFYDDNCLDNIIEKHCAGVDKVVIHCMMSQVRGPKSARLLATRLEEHEGIAKPVILVLRGGFQRWASIYRDDPDLVEDLNDSIWG